VDLDRGAGAVPIIRRDRLAAVRYGAWLQALGKLVVYVRDLVMGLFTREGLARVVGSDP
jgi:hypothetical protein